MAEQQQTSNTAMIKTAVDRILQTDADKLTKTFLEEMFAGYHDRETGRFMPPNFKPTMKFTLTKDMYPYVKEPTETTLGKLIMNRYLLERTGAIKFIGYWNKPINNKALEALNTEINNLVVNDQLTTTDLCNYIDSRDRLGFWCAAFLSVSITPALLAPMDNVNKRKAELFKQYKAELASDNPVIQVMTTNKIEKELMGIVRENLSHDTGYDLYASGDGNLDNNYKTINVMRGAVYNNISKKYSVVDHSLMQGITKYDIPAFANSVVAAAYPSAVGTADAGYTSKIIMALLQSESINPNPESDCGTESTIPVMVTNRNKQYLIFRYIKEGKNKKLTTLHNIDDYVGKVINLYSPQCCCNDPICGKCAGRVFYNLGVTRIGLLSSQITQKMLNIKLKSKHDLSQNAGIVPHEMTFLDASKLYEVTPDGYLKTNANLKLFIPKMTEEMFNNYEREATSVSTFGVMPAKFYDKNGNVVQSTLLIIPAQVDLKLYEEPQETQDNIIISYEPGAIVTSLSMQKNIKNVEYFINNIYLNSKVPLIPYKLMTDMMFRCLELNGMDLTGPSITYELLARRVCRIGDTNKPFAYAYGKQPGIDQMSYTKLAFREAVQRAGVLQGVLFQDISNSMNIGLAQTLNGEQPTFTPLEELIRV